MVGGGFQEVLPGTYPYIISGSKDVKALSRSCSPPFFVSSLDRAAFQLPAPRAGVPDSLLRVRTYWLEKLHCHGSDQFSSAR